MKDNYNLELIKKPKRKNSRRKGNNFELEVAKILNVHYCTEEFQRSPGSGAFGTTHKLPEHMRLYGDLITPKNFRFCIECKAGYEDKLKIADLLNEDSLLFKIVKKAEEDSLKAFKNKFSYLIILKQSRKDIIVFTPEFSVNLFRFNPGHMVSIQVKEYSLLMMPLKEFLSVLGSEYFFEPE